MTTYLFSISNKTLFGAALLIAAVLFAAACDSSDPDDNSSPTLNGTFGGTIDGTDDTVSVRIVITEGAVVVGGKAIGGSGTLMTPSEDATFDVAGSYVHPLIELDLHFTDRPPGTLSGQVTESRAQISGTVTGPGVAGQITLTRESV